jgi:N-dimethylarginine dimethylaminohydrolase
MSDILLMCNPVGYAVNYEINPWMQHQTGRVSVSLARSQWQGLHRALGALAEIRLMDGDPAWPDLVFTANAGLPLVREKKIILSNFKYPQRQGEKALDRAWFEQAGWACVDLPDGIIFEGAGDALFDSEMRLWAGGGPRACPDTAAELARHIKTPIHRLELTDPRYYHLDTCFCPLPGGYALYLPQAFDAAARAKLAQNFGAKLIPLTEAEGALFCANAVCVGHTLVMNQATPRLQELLGGLGFVVVETPLSEFIKSGGSAKCLTLGLGEGANAAARPRV